MSLGSPGLRLDVSKIPENPFAANPPAEIPDLFTATCIEDALVITQNLLNRGLKDDIDARRLYAKRTFILVVAWVIFLFSILLFQGFYGHETVTICTDDEGNEISVAHPACFVLADNVLMATIGGTTVSIIGIFMVVMKNLFPAYPSKRTISSKD